MRLGSRLYVNDARGRGLGHHTKYLGNAILADSAQTVTRAERNFAYVLAGLTEVADIPFCRNYEKELGFPVARLLPTYGQSANQVTRCASDDLNPQLGKQRIIEHARYNRATRRSGDIESLTTIVANGEEC
jgi:hypothetical protein